MKSSTKERITLTACGCVMAGVIFIALFSVFRMPDSSMEGPTGNGDRLEPRQGAVVVVLRWVRKDALAVGDLVVVARDSEANSQRFVRSIAKIDEAEPQRPNSGRRRNVIAEGIRAMDLERVFSVTDRNGTNTWRIPARRIHGKVMASF